MRHPGATCESSPQADRDPHPVRAPALGNPLELADIRVVGQPVFRAHRSEQTAFTGGQLVDRAQRAEPDELRAEVADARQPFQGLEGFAVRHPAQRLSVEVPASAARPRALTYSTLRPNKP